MIERVEAGDEVCHVESAISLVGGKWKLMLIRLLLFRGPSRFNALARELAAISNKVLSQNLRELEDDNIIVRSEQADGHHRYALSDTGSELLPVLKALGDWSERRESNHETSRRPNGHDAAAQGEL